MAAQPPIDARRTNTPTAGKPAPLPPPARAGSTFRVVNSPVYAHPVPPPPHFVMTSHTGLVEEPAPKEAKPAASPLPEPAIVLARVPEPRWLASPQFVGALAASLAILAAIVGFGLKTSPAEKLTAAKEKVDRWIRPSDLPDDLLPYITSVPLIPAQVDGISRNGPAKHSDHVLLSDLLEQDDDAPSLR